MFTGVRQACPALRGVASGRSRTFRIANRRGANRALSRLRRDLRSGECDRICRGRISHSLNRRSSRSGPTAESPPAGSAILRVRPDLPTKDIALSESPIVAERTGVLVASGGICDPESAIEPQEVSTVNNLGESASAGAELTRNLTVNSRDSWAPPLLNSSFDFPIH